MLLRRSTCAVAVTLAATLMMVGAVQAIDTTKYPDWKGAWARWAPPNSARDPGNGGTGFTAGGQPSFDQTKPWGLGQQAPLTPEYQKVLEDSIADQEKGGEGNFFDHAVRCMPGGMPLMTIAFTPLEFVVTPATTYILIGGSEHFRRIFTDGRDWPTDISRPMQAIRSAGGSMRTATGSMMCSWLKRAAPLRVPALMTQPACRFISTTNQSSLSGSTAIRPT